MQGHGPATQVMEPLLDRADAGEKTLMLSVINLGEIYYSVFKMIGTDKAQGALEALRTGLKIVAATDEVVLQAAELKARYPISYPDAFAALTAVHYDADLVTGDPDFLRLQKDGLIRLEWVSS